MLWCGSKVRSDLTQSLRNTKFNQRMRVRNLAFELSFRCNFNYHNFAYYVPSTCSMFLLKSKNLKTPYTVVYALSDVYFFKFPLPVQHQGMTVDNQTRTVSFHHFYVSSYFQTFTRQFNLILFSFFRVYFNKLKFKGKGYYIYKNFRNTITPQFGYSHRLYFYAFAVSVKFLSKTTIFIFGLSLKDIHARSYQIKKSKSINIFTGRGVRFARQVVYRKTGKVSSYR